MKNGSKMSGMGGKKSRVNWNGTRMSAMGSRM